MESLDYRYFNICINSGNAKYETDGSVKIIVAHTNPQKPNWLNTCSHSEGTMCWRWYRLADGEKPVEPGCAVVSFKTLQRQ
jgi:hypothetical protein